VLREKMDIIDSHTHWGPSVISVRDQRPF